MHTFFTHPVGATECCRWENQNVIRTWNVLVHTKECKCIQWSVAVGKIEIFNIRTRECCCEPIKMNIAMIVCTICMGWKQRNSTDLQTLLVRGKRFQFYLLQNFELPPQYIQKREIYWECRVRNFEVINTGCSLPCTI